MAISSFPMASRPAGEFKYQLVMINDMKYVASEIVVGRFKVEWSDDVMLTAGEPLHKWEQSEVGKWVMAHAVETPRWERCMLINTFEQDFAIIARLTEPDQTFFRLKFT